jgi:hypothetical protein
MACRRFLAGVDLGEEGAFLREMLILLYWQHRPQERTPMNYSTCLMALAASRVEELETQVHESLQPHLQRLAELVTLFFGPRDNARRGLGV